MGAQEQGPNACATRRADRGGAGRTGAARRANHAVGGGARRALARLEEHSDEVVGVLGDPRLLPGEAVPRRLVRLQVLEVLQVGVLAVQVRLRVVSCAPPRERRGAGSDLATT